MPIAALFLTRPEKAITYYLILLQYEIQIPRRQR